MNTYLMTQLAEIRHQELVDDAREYRRARAARPTAWFHRGSTHHPSRRARA